MPAALDPVLLTPKGPLFMLRSVLRLLLAVAFVLAGLNHFRDPRFYLAIMPPALPWHLGLIYVSGVFEVLGGLFVLVPATRRLAGWGLIALLLAVFPANIYAAVANVQLPGAAISSLMWWLRLPFQAVFIAWVYFAAVAKAAGGRS
jgi:uncharacterized membrane protein